MAYPGRVRRSTAWVAIAAMVTACGGVSSTSSTSVATSTTSMPATSTVTVVSTTTTTTTTIEGDLPPLALYLASIERGLEGTELEGAAFAESEALIDTGVLFCRLLDEGFSPTDVLRAWVAALSADGEAPTEDDLMLGGLVLGAAARFVCPQHLAELDP